MESTMLFRTLNVDEWAKAEEKYLQCRQPLLYWKSSDGFEFWVLEEDGYLVQRTVYGDRSIQHRTRPVP